MPLDPKTIREAQEAYRQWNEAELRDRLLTAPTVRPMKRGFSSLHYGRTVFLVRAHAHVPENPFIVAVDIDGVIVDFLLTLLRRIYYNDLPAK